jgi:hypothetical protein
MTQFQSTVKNNQTKDNRTLFECNQFRIPTVSISTDIDEPSESYVIKKRPIQQEQTTNVPNK